MEDRVIINLTPLDITAIEGAITTINGIIVPKLANLSNDKRKSYRKMGIKNTGYVDGIHAILEAHNEIIPPSYEIARFDVDRAIHPILSEFYIDFATITELFSDSELIIGHQNMGDADAGLDLIKAEAKRNSTIKTALDEFLAGHKSPRIPLVKIGVPKSGSATVQNIAKGSRFTNRGTTVFVFFKDAMTTGGVEVGPGDSTIIPEGWTTIKIVNNSTTTDGEYTIA